METFKDVISSDQLVLVDFFATWCQPCKMMHPILEQVKEVLGDRIRIIKVDVDKYGVTASQYGIQSVPTLMLFRRGEVLWRTSGVMQKSELLATGKSSVSCPLKPSDSAPLKHSTMPP